MTFRQIITPDTGDGVAGHTHDGSEVSGEATFITLRVNRLLAGTIDGKEIIVSGGVDGILRSDNYVAGSAGWQVLGDGSAEFSDVTVRGVVVAGAGSSIGFDDVTAATNEVALVIGGSGTVRSSNFSAGTAGWSIEGDGSAEFNDVLVRGDIESGNWDGASPANLAAVDATATAGFYMDSSAGAMQLEGNLWANGTIIFAGTITTALTGNRADITGDASGLFLSTKTSGAVPSSISLAAGGEIDIRGDGTNDLSLTDFLNIDMLSSTPGTVDQPRLRMFNDSGVNKLIMSGLLGLQAPDGSASAPTHTFIDDTDTGVYRSGTNQLSLAANGTESVRVTATRLGIVSGGTAAAPSLYWTGDTDSGIWKPGDGIIQMTVDNGDTGVDLTSSFHSARSFRPAGNNNTSLGTDANEWSEVWATDTTINTSDPRFKKGIGALPFDALAFVDSLDAIKFKHKTGKRWHLGWSAVDVKQAMDETGFEWGAYIDPSVGSDRVDAKKHLRPGELVPVLWRAVQQLHERIVELEAMTVLENT